MHSYGSEGCRFTRWEMDGTDFGFTLLAFFDIKGIGCSGSAAREIMG
jgi:hypothetical protein